VSLGATRLRIVDIQHGDQPMHSADGVWTIVFNGEIYNHRALRAELRDLGHHFRTQCDTEVVLESYLAWGRDAFRRLRGMFAIGLWNEQERRLLLARDPMGIKPLYYRRHEGELFFGSELKCFFVHPEVPRQMDLNGLNCFLRLNYVPAPYTLIEGITKLRPGHLLEWHDHQIAIKEFAGRDKQPKSAPRNLNEAVEELDELLKLAVGEQLVAEVPLGIWLSGGVDSSTITHYASMLCPRKLKTFSITFQGKSFDEGGYIHNVTKHYCTDHSELDLSANADLADVIAEMSYYSDEPSADAGALPAWYLAKLCRRDVTVVLSGEGADELFGGYVMYQADRYRRMMAGLPRPLLRVVSRCASRLPASDEKIGLEYKIKRFLEGSTLSAEEAHIYWNGTFSETEKARIFRFANSAAITDLLRQIRQDGTLSRFLDFDLEYPLADSLLYKVDRMSMAHSIEARPPFLDQRIVDFAQSLPEEFKILGSKTKVVLRALMKNRLPDEVLYRPKVGFDIPVHEWFRGVLRPLLLDTLNHQALKQSELFTPSAVSQLIHEHMSRKSNWGYHLWGLMTVMLWMKRWKVHAPMGAIETIETQRPFRSRLREAV
jgi:asparagine synthase (glutamine-hydrolysing)